MNPDIVDSDMLQYNTNTSTSTSTVVCEPSSSYYHHQSVTASYNHNNNNTSSESESTSNNNNNTTSSTSFYEVSYVSSSFIYLFIKQLHPKIVKSNKITIIIYSGEQNFNTKWTIHNKKKRSNTNFF